LVVRKADPAKPIHANRHQYFTDHFRCPAVYAKFRLERETHTDPGFFTFGPELICFGRLFSDEAVPDVSDALQDVLEKAIVRDGTCHLPFDVNEVVDNLRRERYQFGEQENRRQASEESFVRRTYYAMRPMLPIPVRRYLQQAALRGWDKILFPRWPVDQSVDRLFDRLMYLSIVANGGEPIPFIWFWPNGSSACALVTHDVETVAGRDFCVPVMDLNDLHRIKASFQLIPEERYSLSDQFLDLIRKRGFEINLHDLNHDGNLFQDHREFLRRVARINAYGRKFRTSGFRSGVLYRNLDWYDCFEFSYDMSVPNIGHLDPQPGGCCTTKPYFIGKILEIPVTTTQDYSLFHILQDYSLDLWDEQMLQIQEQNGLMSFIVHPDYVIERRARKVYSGLLARLADLRDRQNVWIPLPRDVNKWWRNRSQMKLVRKKNTWQIEGPDSHRARVAFASLEAGRVVYKVVDERKPVRSESLPMIQASEMLTAPEAFASDPSVKSPI
jgi:hypothetical protein